ncbi:Dihydroxyacetone kinase 1 [Yarrowia sp. C11]|nr:Dihydroxyacetone kinase 1 [Yarrowia sp. C11]KAG5370570.1 Dihydroxyacetone kinase 1 [Yarrowia sp. E02]
MKHFVTSNLVNLYLQSLLASNPQLGLVEDQRVVFYKKKTPNKVRIVSGGGSGHEPSWSGLVGSGLLDAAVCGDIFASPSARQVLAGIRASEPDNGVILAITNYTGDKLHFGLAQEKFQAESGGMSVSVIAATDDVALGRTRSAKVGRRGLAGNMLVLKSMGACAESGGSFELVSSVGRAVNEGLVTVGCSLDHCSVPGRTDVDFHIPHDKAVLGMGIHNERGLVEVDIPEQPETLIKKMLHLLLNPEDSERAFIPFKKKDEVILLVNNFGGLSTLENGALTQVALAVLQKSYNLVPCRVLSGAFETSLDGPGFSITLYDTSYSASLLKNMSTSQLLDFIDAPTDAPAWPKVGVNVREKEKVVSKQEELAKRDCQVSPFDEVIIRTCKHVISIEPSLTTWDTVMGDGDCGMAARAAAVHIQREWFSRKQSSLLGTLNLVSGCLDDMGGSLGAILGIFVSALIFNLQKEGLENAPKAVGQACESLQTHTQARKGDRTVMDSLIPFCDVYASSGRLDAAVKAALAGAEATKTLKAQYGRASYVTKTADVPDPGAWLFAAVVKQLEGSSS